MSLSNQILDVADDLDRSILKDILREHAPPAIVKTANIATQDAKEKLGRENFALVAFTKEGSELRKFTISDAANTWLSCQYFEKTAHKLPAKARTIAAGMLKKACALYALDETPSLKGVKPRSGNVYYEMYDMTKTAQPIVTEAVVQDGSKNFYALGERYPMANSEYVKKAAAYFVDYERDFTDALDRHTFASNVLARAKELGTELEQPKTLAKYASSDYGDILDAQIRMRLDLLQARPEMSAALEKVASYKKEVKAPEFAKLLYAFDKQASLDKYHNSYLADAFKATFEQRLNKTASGYTWESSDGETSLTEKQLNDGIENKYDKIKGYFGVSVTDSLKKHGFSIFESLPIDAKETVAKIIKGDL
jgi:hypothetical protein